MIEGIEPAAADVETRTHEGMRTAAAISAAASLKRIADALTSVSTESATATILHVAWEAGRNFGHGVKQGRQG
jgi:hypothetical protein